MYAIPDVNTLFIYSIKRVEHGFITEKVVHVRCLISSRAMKSSRKFLPTPRLFTLSSSDWSLEAQYLTEDSADDGF
jgi:hypothetical protein